MEGSFPVTEGVWALRSVRLPLRVPYRWARGTQEERHVGLVSHEGIGWGEMAPPPDEPWDAAEAARLLEACRDLDTLPPRLRCGASTALLDHEAQDAGVSLAEHLATIAGRRPSRDVEVNQLLTDKEPASLAHAAKQAMDVGFRVLKLKVGTGDDEARVAAVREAAPGAALRLDANAAWDGEQATAMVDALAPYDIAYIEQPVPPGDPALRRLTGGQIPIALDESVTDAATIAQLRADGVGDVFILKPQRLGGLDRTLAAMDAAGGVPLTVTNSLESSIGVHATLHVASLLPTATACGLATSWYLAEDVAEPPRIHDGRMTVPTGPGLGVSP